TTPGPAIASSWTIARTMPSPSSGSALGPLARRGDRGFEPGRHVPDYRCDVQRSEALLHPRPCRGRGGPVARPVVVLVQHPLQPVVPSHAIEMTSALLDRRVASAVERYRVAAATPERQQDLAAVIRLCGAGAGDAYAARGFRPAAGQRCGDHD